VALHKSARQREVARMKARGKIASQRDTHNITRSITHEDFKTRPRK
jgi:hypothetical protein